MAKAFKVVLADGYTEEFTKANYGFADNFAFRVKDHDGAKFFLKDIEVTYAQFNEACNDALNAWYDKKEETHKKVSVLYGSSNTRVRVWVRK